MLAAVLVLSGLIGAAVLIALGKTADTTQPVKRWYAAGPDR